MMTQTIERNRLQLTALIKLYVSTTHVKAMKRNLEMDTAEEHAALARQRRAIRVYIHALRTGVPCKFQTLSLVTQITCALALKAVGWPQRTIQTQD